VPSGGNARARNNFLESFEHGIRCEPTVQISMEQKIQR